MTDAYQKILDETPLEIKLKVAFQCYDYENWDNGEYKGDAEKYVPIAMEIFRFYEPRA